MQVYPLDAAGNVTATGADGLVNLQLPQTSGTPVATSKVALGVEPLGNRNRTDGAVRSHERLELQQLDRDDGL